VSQIYITSSTFHSNKSHFSASLKANYPSNFNVDAENYTIRILIFLSSLLITGNPLRAVETDPFQLSPHHRTKPTLFPTSRKREINQNIY
jgi:hypothetical protein